MGIVSIVTGPLGRIYVPYQQPCAWKTGVVIDLLSIFHQKVFSRQRRPR